MWLSDCVYVAGEKVYVGIIGRLYCTAVMNIAKKQTGKPRKKMQEKIKTITGI